MNKVLVVIPARYGSKRLPGKPLVDLNGKPLIQRVYESVHETKIADKIIVATDSKKIKKCVQGFGGFAEMTSRHHASGTDRVIEVIKKYKNYSNILNIQGDEPIIYKEWINKLLTGLSKGYDVVTICKKEENVELISDPNIVKVVINKKNEALYFSRASIPYDRDEDNLDYFLKHIGIYGFKRDYLLQLNELESEKNLEVEKLEQLKFLYNGTVIKCAITDFDNHDINTQKDIDEFLIEQNYNE